MSDSRGERYGNDADMLSARLSSMSRVAPKSPTEALQPEPVPPPPARSRAARHPLVVFLNFVLTIVVVAWSSAGGALIVGKMQFDRPAASTRRETLTIERGIGLSDIADLLQKNGVIASKWLFVAGVWFNKTQNELKAGEYLIPAHASMREVMDAIVGGKVDPLLDHPARGPDQPADRRPLNADRDSRRHDFGDPAGRLAAARDLQVHPRRHAREHPRPDAPQARQARHRHLEPARARPAAHQRRTSSSRSPRSSRRRPRSPTSGAASPPSSSIGCASTCGCSPTRR